MTLPIQINLCNIGYVGGFDGSSSSNPPPDYFNQGKNPLSHVNKKGKIVLIVVYHNHFNCTKLGTFTGCKSC
jgi:hypothetical protein